MLKVADELPAPLQGVGLFQPRAEYIGIGRISTGLGTPHIEAGIEEAPGRKGQSGACRFGAARII